MNLWTGEAEGAWRQEFLASNELKSFLMVYILSFMDKTP